MMKLTPIFSLRRAARFALPVLAALSLGACVSYSPSQLTGMNTVDLCELGQMQGPNLSPETRSAMQSELQRRNESCSKYSAVLAQRYSDFMYRETYGRHDNP
jgi:hypothetical protein